MKVTSTWYALALVAALLPAQPVATLVAARAGEPAGFLAGAAWTACVTATALLATPLSRFVRFGPLGLRELATGFGAGVLLFVLGAAGYVFAERVLGLSPPSRVGALASLDGAGEMAPVAVLMVAAVVAEEAAFRGVVLEALRRGGASLVPVLASAVLFAGYHLSLYQLPSTLAYGTVLAALTVWTGGIAPAVVAHLTLNGLGLVLSVMSAGAPGG